MFYYFIYGLFIAACLIMVASVLLQPGKADAGALFTSNISSNAFGPRGTQSVLARITIGAAAAFMLLAFLLSQPALTGNRSVLDSFAAPAESPIPAASPTTTDIPVQTNGSDANTAAPNANTAVVVPANGNTTVNK